MIIMNQRPDTSEYNAYYEGYVQLARSVVREDYLSTQYTQWEETLQAFRQNQDLAYAEGKWTVRQLLRHVIDTERIFCYRATAFARGDNSELPGFDQNEYIEHGPDPEAGLNDLLAEFQAVRSSTEWFYKNLPEERASAIGTASGSPVSVRALAYMIIGHAEHHLNILKERYVPALTA